MVINGSDMNSYWRPNWAPAPAPITCNCACSICLSGYCCMAPYPKWWPDTLVWPYLYQPYTVTTGTTLTPGWACAKCGGDKIGTRYHTGTWPTDGGCDHSQKRPDGPSVEHLHRTCQTCGFNWRDPILGAEK
jgi:hypothetical protein